MIYKIAYSQFYPEGLIVIQYEIAGVEDMITVDASLADFDKFLPEIESFTEGNIQTDEGKYIARFDNFGNLHWLLESFDGHIHYRVKNCNNIIDELIKLKLHGNT